MLIKTAELSGAALDWAVAEAEYRAMYAKGEYIKQWVWEAHKAGENTHPYSTDWAQGGPIIDCLDMQFWKWGGGPREEMQCATIPTKEEYGTRLTTYFGKTKLVAGLRAYVANKLGDEIEVPDEIVKEMT